MGYTVGPRGRGGGPLSTMMVRRVRLLSEPRVRAEAAGLRAPRARRIRGPLDRVRVRSVWLRSEEGELQTAWGWRPEGEEGAPERTRKPPTTSGARQAPADDFLPGLR